MKVLLEKGIKIKLIKYLYSKNPNSVIVPEIGLGGDEFMQINAMADIVELNNEITIYEIKSARDSLARLKHQISHYLKYANRVFVVIDEKFINKLQIPDQVGILVVSGNKIIEQRSATSSQMEVEFYLKHWWSIERRKAFRGFKTGSFANLSKSKETALHYFSNQQIADLTIARLKQRYKDESDLIRKLILEKRYYKLFPHRDLNPKEMKIEPMVRMNKGKIEFLTKI